MRMGPLKANAVIRKRMNPKGQILMLAPNPSTSEEHYCQIFLDKAYEDTAYQDHGEQLPDLIHGAGHGV